MRKPEAFEMTGISGGGSRRTRDKPPSTSEIRAVDGDSDLDEDLDTASEDLIIQKGDHDADEPDAGRGAYRKRKPSLGVRVETTCTSTTRSLSPAAELPGEPRRPDAAQDRWHGGNVWDQWRRERGYGNSVRVEADGATVHGR